MGLGSIHRLCIVGSLGERGLGHIGSWQGGKMWRRKGGGGVLFFLVPRDGLREALIQRHKI
jgi:hypothetical protein